MNYYNEHDIKTAQWLQALIDQKLIPQGHVDTRSIIEVTPNDLRNYTQCHFFAGIGGWPRAFQLAGVPATTRLWTGSCPCQPFSTAGKGLAQADERHLWPVFFELVRQCRPEFIFGEQVASAIGHGWLDGISADLEVEGYACGSAVLGAHSIGAPHIRQRLYWVANTKSLRGGQGEPDTRGSLEGGDEEQRSISFCGSSNGSWLADSEQPGLEGQSRHGNNGSQPRRLNQDTARSTAESGSNGSWSDFQLIPCRDGKTRRIPTEPAFFPLAHGVPSRVVRLRGYGNAIVPQVAAEFIRAFYETQEDEDFC